MVLSANVQSNCTHFKLSGCENRSFDLKKTMDFLKSLHFKKYSEFQEYKKHRTGTSFNKYFSWTIDGEKANTEQQI